MDYLIVNKIRRHLPFYDRVTIQCQAITLAIQFKHCFLVVGAVHLHKKNLRETWHHLFRIVMMEHLLKELTPLFHKDLFSSQIGSKAESCFWSMTLSCKSDLTRGLFPKQEWNKIGMKLYVKINDKWQSSKYIKGL